MANKPNYKELILYCVVKYARNTRQGYAACTAFFLCVFVKGNLTRPENERDVLRDIRSISAKLFNFNHYKSFIAINKSRLISFFPNEKTIFEECL